MIKTVCTSCGNVREFEEKYLGKKFKCPKCSNLVLIDLIEDKKEEVKEKSDVHPLAEKLIKEVEEVNQKYAKDNELAPQLSSPKKSSTGVIIFLFLIIVGVIYYFAKSTDNSQSNNYQPVLVDSAKALIDTSRSKVEQTIIQYTPDAEYYINASSNYKIYFYNYPTLSSAKNTFFESQEKVHVSKIDNGFGYVEFINNSNEKVIGWVEMKDLIFIGKSNLDSTALQLNNSDIQSNWSEIDKERKEIIIKHIEAEDNRNYSDIIYFYSEAMERYYDINNPTADELQKRYNHLWSITINPKSTITKIDKISIDLYLVTFDFDYYGSKNNTHRTIKNEVTFYKFDEANKIVSLYDNSN